MALSIKKNNKLQRQHLLHSSLVLDGFVLKHNSEGSRLVKAQTFAHHCANTVQFKRSCAY